MVREQGRQLNDNYMPGSGIEDLNSDDSLVEAIYDESDLFVDRGCFRSKTQGCKCLNWTHLCFWPNYTQLATTMPSTLTSSRQTKSSNIQPNEGLGDGGSSTDALLFAWFRVIWRWGVASWSTRMHQNRRTTQISAGYRPNILGDPPVDDAVFLEKPWYVVVVKLTRFPLICKQNSARIWFNLYRFGKQTYHAKKVAHAASQRRRAQILLSTAGEVM